jgi:hypothetical protein
LAIGYVEVELDGIYVHLSIHADGLRWPQGVIVSAETAALIEPPIRGARLHAISDTWDRAPDGGGVGR